MEGSGSRMQIEEGSSQWKLKEATARRKMEGGSSKRKMGFGDLCRYFQRSLSDCGDDEKAHEVIKVICYLHDTHNCMLDSNKHGRVLEDQQVCVQ